MRQWPAGLMFMRVGGVWQGRPKNHTQKVGLVGYGRAGKAVADALMSDSRFELCWVLRRSSSEGDHIEGHREVPIMGLSRLDISAWFEEHPVDAVVDFSQADTVYLYGEEIKARGLTLVSAISSYTESHLQYLRAMADHARVMSSPNITLGINFLLIAARLLRNIATFADVEIIEQHFREKPDISGTAKIIAEQLGVNHDSITSLRIGGIVGHHEVVFGFPHQTVRLIHDSIRREAFGTGAAFALEVLKHCDNGFYSFDDLIMKRVREGLVADI